MGFCRISNWTFVNAETYTVAMNTHAQTLSPAEAKARVPGSPALAYVRIHDIRCFDVLETYKISCVQAQNMLLLACAQPVW